MFAIEWEENGRHYWENVFTEMGLELFIENLVEMGIRKFNVEIIGDIVGQSEEVAQDAGA